MTAIIMDGRSYAKEIEEELKRSVKELESDGIKPTLATILVGNDPASVIYVNIKHNACERIGIRSRDYHLPEDTDEEKILNLIDELNEDKDVNGILIQLPLPSHIDAYNVLKRLNPKKDVDGLHPENLGKLYYNKCELIPCTPKGIIKLMKKYKIDVAGKKVVIVNMSNLVGKPLHQILINEGALVTLCHVEMKELKELTRSADILVTAVGRRPQYVFTEDMVKEGAVVIDVGINRLSGKIYGDVDFDSVSKKASYITPVPGGVGPMTVAMLLENTIIATKIQMRSI